MSRYKLLQTSNWNCDKYGVCVRIVILLWYDDKGPFQISTHEQSFQIDVSEGTLLEPKVPNYYWGHYFNAVEINDEIREDYRKRVESLFKMFIPPKKDDIAKIRKC